jgi:hypothetical protein
MEQSREASVRPDTPIKSRNRAAVREIKGYKYAFAKHAEISPLKKVFDTPVAI